MEEKRERRGTTGEDKQRRYRPKTLSQAEWAIVHDGMACRIGVD